MSERPPPPAPERPGAARHDRAAWLWLLPALAALLGIGADAAARMGALADPRVRVRGSALLGDWLLGVGLAGALLAALLVAAAQWRADVRRRAAVDQERVAAAERRLLLSRLDHELKNPLTAMRAAVANATAAGSGEGADAALASIEEQTLRLARLTEGLRKIADVQTGVVDRRRTDLSALLTEAVELVCEQPDASGREIKLDLPRAPWPLPPVAGDRDLLSLALVNLIDNAMKYTPPDGTVEIRARESTGDVVVEVADTGVGIDAVDLPHIWEELYRGPQARTVPGSGLGLPLVRAVVERHDGSVVAASRLGAGTVVRVRIPAAPVADP